MTWLLVRMSPEELMMIPVPSAMPALLPASVFTTSTMEGSTAAAVAAALMLLLPGRELLPGKELLPEEEPLPLVEDEPPGVVTIGELGRRARPTPAPMTPETRAITATTAITTGAMREVLDGPTGG